MYGLSNARPDDTFRHSHLGIVLPITHNCFFLSAGWIVFVVVAVVL